MNRIMLIGLAALCSFFAAGLNLYASGWSWITGLQVLSGILMMVAAARMRSKS
jgi:hypothetical protein